MDVWLCSKNPSFGKDCGRSENNELNQPKLSKITYWDYLIEKLTVACEREADIWIAIKAKDDIQGN